MPWITLLLTSIVLIPPLLFLFSLFLLLLSDIHIKMFLQPCLCKSHNTKAQLYINDVLIGTRDGTTNGCLVPVLVSRVAVLATTTTILVSINSVHNRFPVHCLSVRLTDWRMQHRSANQSLPGAVT